MIVEHYLVSLSFEELTYFKQLWHLKTQTSLLLSVVTSAFRQEILSDLCSNSF